MDRPTFTATHLAWSRLVGEIRVTHYPASPGRGAYEYLSLKRICSKESVREVVDQMLTLAIESNAYMTTNVVDGYVQVQIGVHCDIDDAAPDEVKAEPTERMEVVQ